MTRPRRRRRPRGPLLAALLVLLALPLCSQEPPADDIDLFRKPHPFFSYFMQPDGPLLWRLRPGRYDLREQLGENLVRGLSRALGDVSDLPPLEINEWGLRGPLPRKAKPGLRVLCLGDSVTFGYRTPYPVLLARRLAQALGGKSVEVINAGVPGYSIAQGRRWFERELRRWRPDVVVALFGWNDAKDRLRGYRDGELMESWWRRLLSRWRAPLSPLAAIGKDPLSRESGCCRVPPPEFQQEYERLAALVRVRGGLLLAATYPTVFDLATKAMDLPPGFAASRKARMGALNEGLARAAAASRWRLLRLAQRVAEAVGPGYYNDPARDPIHPSEKGMEEIATLVSDALLQAPELSDLH